jgi:hypothetical protein
VKLTATSMLLAALLAGAATTARADIQESGGEILISSPAVSWKIAIPRGDWKIVQQQKRPDGSGFIYSLTSAKQLLDLTVFLERSGRCSSGAGCRALFLRDPGLAARRPKDVKLFEEGGFHAAQFFVDAYADAVLRQANLSAHMYRDGHWIEVRVSLVTRKPPDPETLLAVLRSVTLK